MVCADRPLTASLRTFNCSEWASLPISLYGRNSASGTYGYFKEHVLSKGDYKATVKEQPGSAAVVKGITEDRAGAGYSGIGYATAGVRAVHEVFASLFNDRAIAYRVHSNFDHSVEIDQGSGDGVKSGMAVVTTGNAVFGRINTTTGGRSTVTLITTADFQVGVRLADGTRAVAQGQGRDRPLLIDSVEVTRAKVGDWVYTSGVEQSPFPKDLKIGKVTKVDTIPGQGTTLEVEPLADLSSVYVKVVLKDPPK